MTIHSAFLIDKQLRGAEVENLVGSYMHNKTCIKQIRELSGECDGLTQCDKQQNVDYRLIRCYRNVANRPLSNPNQNMIHRYSSEFPLSFSK